MKFVWVIIGYVLIAILIAVITSYLKGCRQKRKYLSYYQREDWDAVIKMSVIWPVLMCVGFFFGVFKAFELLSETFEDLGYKYGCSGKK